MTWQWCCTHDLCMVCALCWQFFTILCVEESVIDVKTAASCRITGIDISCCVTLIGGKAFVLSIVIRTVISSHPFPMSIICAHVSHPMGGVNISFRNWIWRWWGRSRGHELRTNLLPNGRLHRILRAHTSGHFSDTLLIYFIAVGVKYILVLIHFVLIWRFTSYRLRRPCLRWYSVKRLWCTRCGRETEA